MIIKHYKGFKKYFLLAAGKQILHLIVVLKCSRSKVYKVPLFMVDFCSLKPKCNSLNCYYSNLKDRKLYCGLQEKEVVFLSS